MKVNALYPEGVYDLISKDYDSREWSSLWYDIEFSLVKDWLTGHPGKTTVLDCGSGTAPYYPVITANHKKYAGVDISFEMLQVAKDKYKDPLAFKKGDILNLPFPSGAFDLVLSNRTLSHIEDIALAFYEINRVMKPGGSCLITDVHPRHNYVFTSFTSKWGEKIYVETFKHSIIELEATAIRFGFDVKSSTEILTTDLPVYTLQKYKHLLINKGQYLLIALELIKR